LKFYKYQGTGNDFILLDNRKDQFTLTQEQIAFLCHRNFGIGADGLMLLEFADGFDFKMRYYNSDGRESSMCGNGGRCIVHFAQKLGLIHDSCLFIAIDGPHEASIRDKVVKLKMKDVKDYNFAQNQLIIDTGSPHYVQNQSLNLPYNAFIEEAHKIRYNELFKAQGVNVNFIEPLDDQTFKIRTYERGVEDETLSCGTGVVASAIYHHLTKSPQDQIKAISLGGELYVHLQKTENGFSNIWLEGPVEFVFAGEID
jgi:diaminopimelate epimerase